MAMNKVPSLIIGIGGIGCRIAAGISDLLSEEDRKYVGVIGMDTNVNDLKNIEEHKVVTIQTSDERKVIDFLNLHPEYMSWFPVNRFTVDRGMLNGAGQIRSISRLAALAAEESGMFQPIEEEIKRIRTQRGHTSNGNLTVMIVGSITGGTGAGLFLQLPYYIRKIMKNSAGLDSIIIRGMFMGPDITVGVQPSTINKNAVRVNGYACLKELNAIYMTQTNDNNELEFEYYEHRNLGEERDKKKLIKNKINDSQLDALFPDDDFGFDIPESDPDIIASKGANIPYDYLYLIEGSTSAGGVGNASIGNIENQISHMVFTLLFTPVVDNALSVEDNMVLQDMQTGGMNRYSSAGMCRLVFPNEIAKDYVTMSLTRDLVKDEWLLIDGKYADAVSDARSRQKTDPMTEIPRLADKYVALFNAEVKDGTFGKLYKESFIEGNNRVTVSKSSRFMDVIKSMVQDVLDSDEIQDAQEECRVTENKFKKFKDALSETVRVQLAVEDYTKLAKNIIKQKEGEIANELFPTSLMSMKHRKDNEKCVYQWLYNVHPITARFVCYDIILMLEKRIKQLDSDLVGIDLLEYLEEDYDAKKEGVQDPDTVIRSLMDNKTPVIGNFRDEGKRLNKVRIKFRSVIEGQVDLVTTYISTSLELSVCKTLLKRFEMLADNYRIFFQGISEIIETNNEKIDQLENNKMPLGQLGVYCTKEALRKMAEEYKGKGETDLPEETKKAVFDELFKVFASDYDNETSVRTEKQKEIYAHEKKRILSNVFKTAVIDTIRTEVVKKGADIVDLNIHQALIKEMELERNIYKDFSNDYDKQAEEYVRERIEQAMNVAAPMLAVDRSTMKDNTETVYLALNTDCAIYQDGVPSASATAEAYVPQATAATDNVKPSVLVDEEFSPYEFICFKARYKFSIEDLIKYRPHSDNAVAYNNRISELGRKPANENDPEAFKTVVNPHLCRYWHEEGFLPPISSAERRKAHEDLLKAFVYAMGYDIFVREKYSEIVDDNDNARLLWHVVAPQGARPVMSRGKFIGNNYADLYNAIPFNGRIKKYILAFAAAKVRKAKGHSDAEELFENIMQDDFIVDLIQPVDGKEDEGDTNIIDIFIEMRDYMDSDKWNELFTGLQETLWEYCAYLFDDNERRVNSAVINIIKMIYVNSAPGQKELNGEKLSYAENRTREQIDILLKKRFSK